jgi:hypothetical protein
MIRDGHRFLCVADFPYAADPVFGKEIEKRFSRLFASIVPGPLNR